MRQATQHDLPISLLTCIGTLAEIPTASDLLIECLSNYPASIKEQNLLVLTHKAAMIKSLHISKISNPMMGNYIDTVNFIPVAMYFSIVCLCYYILLFAFFWYMQKNTPAYNLEIKFFSQRRSKIQL